MQAVKWVVEDPKVDTPRKKYKQEIKNERT